MTYVLHGTGLNSFSMVDHRAPQRIATALRKVNKSLRP